MRQNLLTNVLLSMIAIALVAIALKPSIAPPPVDAQSYSEAGFYVEPGVQMLRTPGKQAYGKVMVDLRTGDVWDSRQGQQMHTPSIQPKPTRRSLILSVWEGSRWRKLRSRRRQNSDMTTILRETARRASGSISTPSRKAMFLLLSVGWIGGPAEAHGQTKTGKIYMDTRAPIEDRVNDLLEQMTLVEKARQLDMYSSAREIMSAHTDDTHAALDAKFVPEKAQAVWGDLGVGSVHDLNPTPEQANAIQQWVIAHNRLGIPALFIEEGLHGYDTGTVFPAPIGLAGTWDVQTAHDTGAAIAAEDRAHGVHMILA